MQSPDAPSLGRHAERHQPAAAALNPAQAAAYLGVCRQTIYALNKQGSIPFYKVGRSTRIRISDLDALIGGPQQEVPA